MQTESEPKEKSELVESLKPFFWLILLLLFPALIAGSALTGLKKNLEKKSLESRFTAASLEMARLQREMNLHSVLNEALENFAGLSAKKLADCSDSNLALKKLEEIFFRRFPKGSEIMWFSSTGKMLKVAGQATMVTAWEKFVLSVCEPEKLRSLDKKIADGFVKREMSDFLSADFFRNIDRAPLEVFWKTRRVVFRLVRMSVKAGQEVPDRILFCLPVENSRPDWLENRALKKITGHGIAAGAIRFSDQIALEESAISANLMHGFSEDFRKGLTSKVWNGNLYLFSHQLGNPDLFLCVAIPAAKSGFQETLLGFLQIVIYLPFIFMITLRISGRKSDFISGMSLKTRFRLATAGLSAAPVLLMFLAGLLYMIQVESRIEQNRINALENKIADVSDFVTLQTARLENILRNQITTRIAKADGFQKMANDAFATLADSGCHLTMILTPAGGVFFKSSLEESQIKPRMSFFIGMIKMPLLNENFNVERLEQQTKSALGDSYSKYRERKFRYDFHDRLNSIEMGPTVASLFSTFVRDGSGNIIACLGLGFEAESMKQSFLKMYLKNEGQGDMRVFLKPGRVSGTDFAPRSTEVKELLNLTALTGKPFVKKISWAGSDYLVCSQILKNADSAAAAVMKIGQAGDTAAFVFAILALIFALSLANSRLIQKQFLSIFLKPVLLLTGMVNEIRDGVYSTSLQIVSTDEVGELFGSFNQMVVGLQEKAEMKKYLNEELFFETNSENRESFERTTATVMFCGIRNFIQLEEKLDPEESFSLMNHFLATCDEAVNRNGGQIDKFIGETAMAFFRGDESINSAVKAAIEIKNQVQTGIPDETDGDLTFGVGIAFGELIAGKIGSHHRRLDYTVIGDPVNLAARLEKLAGRGGWPQILVAEEIYEQINSFYECSVHGSVSIKGKAEQVRIFEVISDSKGCENA
ncbi:MAG: adenylate/guanylate cyclase domain-containing protein [Candidatus Rifleibacteriota bacterium]